MTSILNYRRVAGALAIAVVLPVLAAAPVSAASRRVEQSCVGDVHRLCPREKKDSPALRYCMEAKQNSLSRGCVRALEDAGEVPRGYLKGR